MLPGTYQDRWRVIRSIHDPHQWWWKTAWGGRTQSCLSSRWRTATWRQGQTSDLHDWHPHTLSCYLYDKLFHSPSLRAEWLSVGFETWPPISCFAYCVIGWFKYRLGNSSHAMHYGLTWSVEIPTLFQRPLAMPAVRAEQGGCEIVYLYVLGHLFTKQWDVLSWYLAKAQIDKTWGQMPNCSETWQGSQHRCCWFKFHSNMTILLQSFGF